MQIIGVALVVVIVLFIVWIKMKKGTVTRDREEMLEELKQLRLMAEKDAASQKMAVIRCDALLGRAFAYAGVEGATLGEQLKKANKFFAKKLYEELWTAHKLRNTLVHENYDISSREAVWAVSVYTSAIRQLFE